MGYRLQLEGNGPNGFFGCVVGSAAVVEKRFTTPGAHQWGVACILLILALDTRKQLLFSNACLVIEVTTV